MGGLDGLDGLVTLLFDHLGDAAGLGSFLLPVLEFLVQHRVDLLDVCLALFVEFGVVAVFHPAVALVALHPSLAA